MVQGCSRLGSYGEARCSIGTSRAGWKGCLFRVEFDRSVCPPGCARSDCDPGLCHEAPSGKNLSARSHVTGGGDRALIHLPAGTTTREKLPHGRESDVPRRGRNRWQSARHPSRAVDHVHVGQLASRPELREPGAPFGPSPADRQDRAGSRHPGDRGEYSGLVRGSLLRRLFTPKQVEDFPESEQTGRQQIDGESDHHREQ